MQSRTLLAFAIAICFSLIFSIGIAAAQSSTPPILPMWTWQIKDIELETEAHIVDFVVDDAGVYHGIRCDRDLSQRPCRNWMAYVRRDGSSSTSYPIEPHPANYTEGSLGMDASGDLHLVLYGQSVTESIRYLAWDGLNWYTQTVPAVGQPGKLLIDSSDAPHIFYQHQSAYHHAYLAATVWVTETVDTRCPYELAASAPYVTLDDANRLKAVQNCYTTEAAAIGTVDAVDRVEMIVYHQQEEAGWQSQIIDSANAETFGFTNAAITVDAEGYPHIVYGRLRPLGHDALEFSLISASNRDGSWQTETLTIDRANPPYVEIYGASVIQAITSGETLHVLYEVSRHGLSRWFDTSLTYLGYNHRGHGVMGIASATSNMGGYSDLYYPRLYLAESGMPRISVYEEGHWDWDMDIIEPLIWHATSAPRFTSETFLPTIEKRAWFK